MGIVPNDAHIKLESMEGRAVVALIVLAELTG